MYLEEEHLKELFVELLCFQAHMHCVGAEVKKDFPSEKHDNQ